MKNFLYRLLGVLAIIVMFIIIFWPWLLGAADSVSWFFTEAPITSIKWVAGRVAFATVYPIAAIMVIGGLANALD